MMDTLGVLLAMLGFLVAFDIALNLLFPMPASPRQEPSALARFFNYGRSIEDKVRRIVQPTNEASGPIATAGWYNRGQEQPTEIAPGDEVLMAVYGMSHAHRLARQVVELDGDITLRKRGGPGATLSHSYGFYLHERDRHDASIVVLAILSASIKAIPTMTHMTWNFEAPAPHMYPRFYLDDSEASGLAVVEPPAETLDEFRALLANPEKFRSMRVQLARHDWFFDPWLFDASFADRSAILRAVRRGYGQQRMGALEARVHSRREGFDPDSEAARLARAMVVDFGRIVRSDGQVPFVWLINSAGYDDHLHRLLAPTLEDHDVPYFSTETVAPASDANNFLPDGHFRREIDRKMAPIVLKQLNRLLDR